MFHFARFTPAAPAFLVAALFPMAGLGAAAPERPAIMTEPAVAVDLNHSGRDAIVLRAEQGDGLVAFLPARDGGFSLQLYPNMGPGVLNFATGDMNGDGIDDLFVANADGRGNSWLGGVDGAFTRRDWVELPPDIGPLALTDLDGDGRLDVAALSRYFLVTALQGDGYGVFTRFEDRRGPLYFPRRSGGPVADPLYRSIDRALVETGERAPRCAAAPGWGTDRKVRITAGEQELRVASCDDETVLLARLPADFPVRAFALGDFTGRGVKQLAAVSGGLRPRLQIFEFQGGDAASAGLAFRSLLPEIPNANFNVTAGVGGSVFNPPNLSINVNDTVTWSGLGFHTATSGSPCTANGIFRRTNGTPVTFAGAGSFPYFCEPHCGIGMTGIINVAAAASAGTVPDGQSVPGTPLKISKSGATDITITWGNSCSAGATGYALYEGALPSSGTMTGYNHGMFSCTGNTSGNNYLPTGAGSHYYLIVPETATSEGSYGKDSSGTQIPPGTSPCHPQALPTSC